MTDRSVINFKIIMAPRSEKQYKEIRKEKKQLIESAALKLFATQGFYSTSISGIAKKAGISKGLIYNYFSSKEELLQAIIERGFEEITAPLDPNNDGILTEEEFVFYLDEVFDKMQNDTNFYKLYFSLLLQPGIFSKFAVEINKMIENFSKIVIPFFEKQGIEDPETEILFLGATLDGIGMYFVNNPENFPIHKIKKKILRIYNINI